MKWFVLRRRAKNKGKTKGNWRDKQWEWKKIWEFFFFAGNDVLINQNEKLSEFSILNEK